MKSGGFRRPSDPGRYDRGDFRRVFVDGGFEGARDGDRAAVRTGAEDGPIRKRSQGSKTLLQEYLQAKRLPLPVYTVVETRGAAHQPEFESSGRFEAGGRRARQRA